MDMDYISVNRDAYNKFAKQHYERYLRGYTKMSYLMIIGKNY